MSNSHNNSTRKRGYLRAVQRERVGGRSRFIECSVVWLSACNLSTGQKRQLKAGNKDSD